MSVVLVVMTRVPAAGRTKTRLMPSLNGEQCAELHWAMLRDLGRVLHHVPIAVRVFYCGGEPAELVKVLGPGEYMPQRGGQLGERMADAVDYCLKQGFKQIVIIGTDYPALQPEDITGAIEALRTKEVVLGPAVDGGYYLLALKKTHPEIFVVKSWGTSQVLADTIHNLNSSGITFHLLKPGRDLDTWEDAGYYYPYLSTGKFALKVFPRDTFDFLEQHFVPPG